jgi:3-hydroxybutyryl-CoA dehydrogenase
VERQILTRAEAENALALIEVTTDTRKACEHAHFVIEAAFEELNLKRSVLKELDALCPKDAVLASNTSTISITEIAAATNRPDKVIGMHFFNPAQVLKLVEIIRGLLTSDETVRLTETLVAKLGKTAIVVKDSPGFVTSRLTEALFLEASEILEEGIASVKDIDTALKLAFGHPMGIFEIGDLVGLDIRLKALQAVFEATGNARYKPPNLLKQLVSAGYLGDPKVKPGSRGGYYEYFQLSRK